MENIVLRKFCYGRKKENRDYIEIVYGTDEKFSLAVGVAMSSVREHNKNCIFHWFVTKLNASDFERIKRFSEKYDVVCNIYYINEKLVRNLLHNNAWSTAMYYRLLAALYFNNKLKRVLYLDGDTYCRGDLSNLYHIDLHDNIVAAISDVFFSQDTYNARMQYIRSSGDGYFNSGVLLIDIDKWNKEHITEKALKYLEKELSRWKNAPDQDVLNVLLANKVEWADKKYNILNSVTYGDEKIAKIIHFTGPKPWLAWYIGEGNKIFDKEYYKTMQQSEWRDVPLQGPCKTVEYRYMSKKYLKNGHLLKGIKWHFRYLKHKLF